MGVSKNSGTPKSSILIGFSIIFTIHFGGKLPLFLETPISKSWKNTRQHGVVVLIPSNQPTVRSPPEVMESDAERVAEPPSLGSMVDVGG